MAHRIDITKIHEGPRNAVYHVYLLCDGVTGELTDEVLIDPAELDPALAASPILTVEKLWYDLSGFSGRLEFDFLTGDTGVWSLAEGSGAEFDFTSFGGLHDRSGALDGTGKLMLSTNGFTELNDAGTIIIQVKK